MLRIDRTAKKFISLEQRSLADVKLLERADLQNMIRLSCDAFFNEIGEKLLLVGEEVCPTEYCSDRIDLLAIDSEGAAVVIEIKRGSNRLQLLQGLSYAGMLAHWEADQYVDERARFANIDRSEAREEIVEFVTAGVEGVGQKQRVILLAEGFDFEVLFTAEWLHEKFGVDIRCYRLLLSAEAQSEFVTCTQVFPPPELSNFALVRKKVPDSSDSTQKSWTEALSKCVNEDVASFFSQQLAANRDANLSSKSLTFKVDGRVGWFVSLKKDRAYVWQAGRFADDVEYWTSKLSDVQKVQPVKLGARLRFYLRTSNDCVNFLLGATTKEPVKPPLGKVDEDDSDPESAADS